MDDTLSTSSKVSDSGELDEEEDVIQAVAKHFGKEFSELTLEALIQLEQKGSEVDEENQEEDTLKRKGPSLASILGTVPSAATLGLNESISSCMGDKENGEGLFPVVLSAFIVESALPLFSVCDKRGPGR